MSNQQIKYSVVVPVYNEEAAVKNLHREICEVMRELTLASPSPAGSDNGRKLKFTSSTVGLADFSLRPQARTEVRYSNLREPKFTSPNNSKKADATYEIIFVDDGSTDKTFEILSQLSPIKIIRFRKNFGQTAALDAGIKEAKGEIIITLDGDGQNPPHEIPKLLAKLNEGYDCVSGWRKKRQDSFSKKFLSWGANFLRGFLVKDEIHDSGCTLKAYRRECFEDLDLYGEIHRFIPAILRWQGFKVGEVVVAHRRRQGGKSKYGWKRVIKGFLDMWSVWFWRKYATRPLHLFGGLGIFIGGAGSLLLLYLAIGRFLGLFTLSNRIWPLIAVFLTLVGLQLFVSGILADVMVKTYYQNHKRAYKIKEIIERK